jgi:oxygen-dependent protoporphyrinogen oxidase
MQDVVIIGGGLSGLAAAIELQRMSINYRLIEVKPWLGGSIRSTVQAGFILDQGPFAFPRHGDWSFLPALGLDESVLVPVEDSHDRDLVAFQGGAQMVTDALAKQLTGIIIQRMAVSSLGTYQGRFTLCMENGLVFDAGALIVAAPARHTERMFRTLAPDLSYALFDYHYDTITRVALGYHDTHLPHDPRFPWDMAVPFYGWTDAPGRVPEEHCLVQIDVRMPSELVQAESLVAELQRYLKPESAPVVTQLSSWPEADPTVPHEADFAAWSAQIESLLPEGVVLAGSDYHGLGLAERIRSGERAAQQIAALVR